MILNLEDVMKIRQGALCDNKRALKKYFQRCARKRFPPLKYLRDLKNSEFDGLQYTHRGAISKEGSQYFQEQYMIYKSMHCYYLSTYHVLYLDKDLAIFGTKKQLDIFRKTRTLICDGSFKYRAQGTYQVYRVFGFIKKGHCVPVLTVLMCGKERRMYDLLWKKGWLSVCFTFQHKFSC